MNFTFSICELQVLYLKIIRKRRNWQFITQRNVKLAARDFCRDSLRSCSDEPPSYRWGNRGSEKWNAFPKILQPKTSGLPVLKGFKPWQVDWGQHQSQELGSGVRIPASLVVWTSLNLSFPLHQMGTEMVPTA